MGEMADELEKGFADEGVGRSLRHPVAEATELTRCTIIFQESTEVESLVLNFQKRDNICSSPRNFMLEDGCGQDSRVILQHGRNGQCTWCLDFRHPLSTVQAFAIAMSSLEWN